MHSLSIAQELLLLAGHLQIPHLEQGMERLLEKSLNEETCVPMMYFAAEKNIENLFQASSRVLGNLDVVSRDRAEDIFALAEHFDQFEKREFNCQHLKSAVVEKLIAAVSPSNFLSFLVSMYCFVHS